MNVADRPILFSAPMVLALLAGSKTQTRRVVKAQPPETHGWAGWVTSSTVKADEGKAAWDGGMGSARPQHLVRCPYGKPGDLLWVRESFRLCAEADTTPPRDTDEAYRIWYEADAPHQPGAGKPRRAFHMPRWASRLTLRITDVRVQRLQEISREDAIAEGATSKPDDGPFHRTRSPIWSMDWPATKPAEGWGHVSMGSPQYAFANYVNRIHGGPRWNLKPTNAWNENHWVWAISFEVIRQNIDAVLTAKEAA